MRHLVHAHSPNTGSFPPSISPGRRARGPSPALWKRMLARGSLTSGFHVRRRWTSKGRRGPSKKPIPRRYPSWHTAPRPKSSTHRRCSEAPSTDRGSRLFTARWRYLRGTEAVPALLTSRGDFSGRQSVPVELLRTFRTRCNTTSSTRATDGQAFWPSWLTLRPTPGRHMW